MRIGFLGPEGTFAHAAALAGSAADDTLVALNTNAAVVTAAQAGHVDRAVVPVENILEGAVTAVLDALAFEAPDVEIAAEVVVAVRHALVAATALDLADIRTVHSHPVALGQCQAFLRAQLPAAELVPTASTAGAIRDVVAAGGPHAAIGTELAARHSGGVVVRERVEDNPDNRTRFVWLQRIDAPPPIAARPVGDPGRPKTSVVFHGPGDGAPGWLVRCLLEFADRGVNLTRIESRPLRSRLGHYLFHVDCDGDAGVEPVAGAVSALDAHCEHVRILGTYASATATISAAHGGDVTT